MTCISPHQLGISNLLATAQLIDCLPERLVLLGVEPKDLSTGLGFSEPVAEGLEKIIEAVIKELHNEGFRPEIRAVDAARKPGFWATEKISGTREEKEAIQ